MADELPDIQSQLNSAIAGEAPTTPIEQLGATQFEKDFIAAANAPALEPEPAPAAEPVPATEPTPAPEPGEDPAALVDQPGDGQGLPNNWRFTFKSPEDRMFAQLVKSGVSVPDATFQVYGAPVVAEPEPSAPPVETVLATKEARLDEINATLEKLVEDAGEIGLTVTPDVFKLQKEQAALLREIPQLQREQERSIDDEDFSFNQQEQIVEREAFALFPDAEKDGTPLCEAIKVEVARATRVKDPILQSPERRLLIASKVAAKLGIAPVKANAPASQAAPAPATPPPAAPQAQTPQRAFHPAPSGVASEAQRVIVSTAPVSPLDKFKAVATSAGAGLDTATAALQTFFKPSQANAGRF